MTVVFADTSYYLALLGPTDLLHDRAVAWSRQPVLHCLTSEYVLIEVGNSLARGRDRELFGALLDALPRTTRIIAASEELFRRAVGLFRSRTDKEWSLTDCTSFVIMADEGIGDALSADHHFRQAGFRPLVETDPT